MEEFRSFVRSNVCLADYVRLGVGGTVEYFAEPESELQLLSLLQYCRKRNIPARVIGAGSNILVPDKGVAGVVISLNKPAFCDISSGGKGSQPLITAGAGVRLALFITEAVSLGFGGVEGLIGIPGTVGGALCDNAGSSNDNIGEWIESVRIANLDGTISVLSKDEITFEYRSSSLDAGVILTATFRLESGDESELLKRMQKFWIVRKSQQPCSDQHVIMAFNSTKTGASASDLIEQVNLKGTRIGNAAISEHNSNFIVIEQDANNNNNKKTERGIVDDVKRLIQLVQDRILEKTEVEIEPALRIW
ncbi:MAG: UDP-N-acetylmuramate dehydrogenase [Planctomycetaceae bacterium]|jgi:UDP-N-acetylmuramate dehydrogenase|nr:UDP-N-acetylmuramate dehydrogenase [Planctomycetaceae bacterium]